MSSTMSILEKMSDEYGLGWDDASMLEILSNYIDNQGDPTALESFVREQAESEISQD